MSLPDQQPMDIKTASPEIDIETANTKPTTKAAQPAPPPNPIPLEQLNNHSSYVECPFCKVRGRTDVTYESSDATCLMALGCCCALGIFGVWMPYVFHWGADVDHSCSACKRHLAHVDHGGAVQLQVPRSEEVKSEKEKVQMQYEAMPKMEPVIRKDVPQYVEPVHEAPKYVAVEHEREPDLKIAEAPVLPSAC